MAELMNCEECGRIFASQGGRLCRNCLAKTDEEYAVVRKYVRQHPGADIMEVSRATGIKEEVILRFLREGRLISQGFVSRLKCERCSATIASGRYCPECLFTLEQEFKSVLPQEKKAAKGGSRLARNKMHIDKGE